MFSLFQSWGWRGTVVAAPRGMTPEEAHAFLATGVFPDLTPATPTAPKRETPSRVRDPHFGQAATPTYPPNG